MAVGLFRMHPHTPDKLIAARRIGRGNGRSAAARGVGIAPPALSVDLRQKDLTPARNGTIFIVGKKTKLRGKQAATYQVWSSCNLWEIP
jgi:hypothetical protein